jgi:hypothetical protein
MQGPGPGHVEHFTTCPSAPDEPGGFEDVEVFDHRLTGHRQVIGEPGGARPADVDEHVQQSSAGRVGEGRQDGDLAHARHQRF